MRGLAVALWLAGLACAAHRPGPSATPPVQVARTPAPSAKPADRDGDGIPDAEDACPDVPGVRTNDPQTNGCPPDRDRDGVPDAVDACPDVPGVKTDDPKTNGCPPDRDHDGIPDPEDACPDQPGPRNPDPKKNGCPLAVRIGRELKILEQVQFKTGSAQIIGSDDILNAVAKILLEHPEILRVRIEGHTDNVGGRGYNQNLSTRRAAAVLGWLVKAGVARNRLRSVGYGMSKPRDTNATAEGRQNNRRSEFHIEKEKGEAPPPPPPRRPRKAPAQKAPAPKAP
jgi:OOP family OmpA-OmpF porin